MTSSSNTITKRISAAFEPQNKDHALWLRDMHQMARTLDPTKQSPMHKLLTKNPMNVKVQKEEILEFVHIHFVVSMKYSEAVLNGEAWTP